MLAYNDLLDVEIADARRRGAPGFEDFLESFAELTTQHGLKDAVGASLLHRHFRISRGQVLLETPDWLDDTAVLATQVVDGLPSTAVCSTWSLSGEEDPVPLEFTTDRGAREPQALPPRFICDMRALLATHRLVSLIGLKLLKRTHIALAADECYLEETVGKRSVLRAVPGDAESAESLTTVWAPDEVMGCWPKTRCRQWSTCRRSGAPDDRHSYGYGHDQERVHDST